MVYFKVTFQGWEVLLHVFCLLVFSNCFMQFQGRKEGCTFLPSFQKKGAQWGEKSVTFYLFSFLETMTIFSLPESLLRAPWQRTRREWKSTKMQGPGEPPGNEKLMNGHAVSGCGLELGRAKAKVRGRRQKEGGGKATPI